MLGSIFADVLPFLTHDRWIAAWSMRSVMETVKPQLDIDEAHPLEETLKFCQERGYNISLLQVDNMYRIPCPDKAPCIQSCPVSYKANRIAPLHHITFFMR